MISGEVIGWACEVERTQKECRAKARKVAPRGRRGRVAETLYKKSCEAGRTRQARRAQQGVDELERRARPGFDYRAHLIRRRNERLVQIGGAEAARRHLGTPTCSPAGAGVRLWDLSGNRRVWLIGIEKKQHYSNRFGDWWVRAAWLCGRDEGKLWAARVPGTIGSVDEALDWLTPAEVKRAMADPRKQVVRQGDIYFVQKLRGRDNTRALRGTRHRFDPETRTVNHPEHAAVVLTWTFKAVRQTQLASNSRGAYRRGAD